MRDMRSSLGDDFLGVGRGDLELHCVATQQEKGLCLERRGEFIDRQRPNSKRKDTGHCSSENLEQSVACTVVDTMLIRNGPFFSL